MNRFNLDKYTNSINNIDLNHFSQIISLTLVLRSVDNDPNLTLTTGHWAYKNEE